MYLALRRLPPLRLRFALIGRGCLSWHFLWSRDALRSETLVHLPWFCQHCYYQNTGFVLMAIIYTLSSICMSVTCFCYGPRSQSNAQPCVLVYPAALLLIPRAGAIARANSSADNLKCSAKERARKVNHPPACMVGKFASDKHALPRDENMSRGRVWEARGEG